MAETQPEIVICRDAKDLSRRVAEEFVRLADESIKQRGRLIAALSGGSTPKGVYSLLATPKFRKPIPWGKVYLFFGDERAVPPDAPESNYRMANETLLSKVPLPRENIFRFRGEEWPEDAARQYERSLREFFELGKGGVPCFDLILLGLGEDGHTASLFPGSDALLERKRLVSAPYVEKLNARRLTLTLPVINRAANIFFLVAGKNKASVLRDVLQGKTELPAALVRPVNGRLVWFVDQEAAKLIIE